MTEVATVTVEFEMDEEQVQRARQRAALLDRLNLGGDDPPDSYSPAQALARILASDAPIIAQLIPKYTDGYTAEEVHDG